MAFRLKTAIIFIFSVAMKQIEHSAEGSTSSSVLSCLERILPCQYSMHDLNPPPYCCMHLKGMMDYNPKCICSVFRNDNILHALNSTALEAANLTANCGLKPDFKLCDGGESGCAMSPFFVYGGCVPNDVMHPGSPSNDTSTSSITLGENFRNADVFIWISISLLIMVGLM